MKQVEPDAIGRTVRPAGATFMCGADGAYQHTYHFQTSDVRTVAGSLLEETGAWYRAVRHAEELGLNVPPAVTTAIDAAYYTALEWVELLDAPASTTMAERARVRAVLTGVRHDPEGPRHV